MFENVVGKSYATHATVRLKSLHALLNIFSLTHLHILTSKKACMSILKASVWVFPKGIRHNYLNTAL